MSKPPCVESAAKIILARDLWCRIYETVLGSVAKKRQTTDRSAGQTVSLLGICISPTPQRYTTPDGFFRYEIVTFPRKSASFRHFSRVLPLPLPQFSRIFSPAYLTLSHSSTIIARSRSLPSTLPSLPSPPPPPPAPAECRPSSTPSTQRKRVRLDHSTASSPLPRTTSESTPRHSRALCERGG